MFNKNFKKIKNKKAFTPTPKKYFLVWGFTLIELVLYASLVSILVLGVSSFWSVMKTINLKNKSISAVEDQGAFIADLMSQKIREASLVCVPSSSGDSASTLDLDTSCTVHTSNRVQLGLTGGILEITEGVNSPIALTDTRTYISSITFTKAKDPLGGTASVNYTFTMQSKSYSSTQEFGYQKTFLGGGTLRVE